MGDVLYNNADLRQAATQAMDAIRNAPNRVAEQGQGAIGALNSFGLKTLGKGAQSSEDIQDLINSLKQSATGDKVPVAGQMAQDQLNNVLSTVQPAASPSHIPLAPGAGRTAIDDFNTAFGRWRDTDRIAGQGGWESKAAVAGGPGVDSQARSYLLSDEGQRLAPQGSPQYDLYNTLAATAIASISCRGAACLASGTVRHVLQHAIEPAIMGIAAGGGEAAHGGGWGDILGATAAGGALGYGLHKGVPWVQSVGQQARQQAALDAAKVGTSLGQNVAPVAPLTPLRNAIRQLIYGGGTVGGVY